MAVKSQAPLLEVGKENGIVHMPHGIQVPETDMDGVEKAFVEFILMPLRAVQDAGMRQVYLRATNNVLWCSSNVWGLHEARNESRFSSVMPSAPKRLKM